MVAAVNLRMAVRATPVGHEETVLLPGNSLVPALLMALLTQARLLGYQHHFVIRAVWVVAIQTAFFYCRVLPQHRCLEFLVTLIALVVYRICRNEAFCLGTMWIMAINAAHFSLAISPTHVAQRVC